MIRYALVCDGGHEFEGWFASSSAYDEQSGRGLVACPVCASTAVEKALMAPAVSGTRSSEEDDAPLPPEAAPAPVAILGERERALRAVIDQIREQVMRTTVDVGPRFAEEARRMHEGESEARGIRGEASLNDIRALLEDGIEVMPLPVWPEGKN